MKINYKNTALGLLDKIDPFSFTISQDVDHTEQSYKTKLGLSIVREWPKMMPRFRKKIRYISDPFHEAYQRAAGKLVGVIDAEPINESGTLISKAGSKEYNTIFYDIRSEGKDKDFRFYGIILFFSKETDRPKPNLCVLIHRMDEGVKVYLSERGAKQGATDLSIFIDVFTLLLFLKYCDLETKLIKGNSKAEHINCKYLNETNRPIEILDSTWFTTIVRSEGFKVRGHFRMQPFGEGMSQRKLIWINDFDKHGYTRTAKVLNQDL